MPRFLYSRPDRRAALAALARASTWCLLSTAPLAALGQASLDIARGAGGFRELVSTR